MSEPRSAAPPATMPPRAVGDEHWNAPGCDRLEEPHAPALDAARRQAERRPQHPLRRARRAGREQVDAPDVQRERAAV